jgi:nicotinamidase/pyrazinamidase
MKINVLKDALLVADLQRDFLPGGALPIAAGDEIVVPIARLTERFTTVVAAEDFHPRGHVSFASSHPGKAVGDEIDVFGERQRLWPDHCVAGSSGAELNEALPDSRLTLRLRKGTRREVDSYSAFRENVGPSGQRESTGLGGLLFARGVRRLFIVGLARDYCVLKSALDAVHEGFETWILDDLTRAIDLSQQPEIDRQLSDGRVGRLSSDRLW